MTGHGCQGEFSMLVKNTRVQRNILLSAVLLLVTFNAGAHHSVLNYDGKVIVEITHAGKLKSVLNEPTMIYRYPS